jgi:hypothetical protein
MNSKFYFTVYLVTLSVAQNVECRVVELVQNDSKRVWKEAILVLDSHKNLNDVSQPSKAKHYQTRRLSAGTVARDPQRNWDGLVEFVYNVGLGAKPKLNEMRCDQFMDMTMTNMKYGNLNQ